jgi:benzylsuccinate CoA-transferase BbsF subunit
VITFGAFVAGNISGKLLAELGADVVKIEPRSRPEVLRTPAYAIGKPFTEPSGVPNTVMYATLVRGARSLSIDLAIPESRPVFHRLVAGADVVIENFGGAVLDEWGCSYADLLNDNPRLVMLSLSGYGRSGPRRGYLAYASTICSFIGLSAAWGYDHGTLTDYLTAATGAIATIAALGHARATGSPRYIDVAQIDALPPMLAALYVDPLNSGREPVTVHNHVPGSWLSGVFRCRGYESWLAIDIEDRDDWGTLCAFLDRRDLVVESPVEAEATEPFLRAEIEAWASRHSAHTAMHAMQKAGLAAAVVQASEDMWRDPQLRARGFGEEVDQPDLGVVTYPTSAQRWTKTPGSIRHPPPRLGQHTREVLREWVGLSEDELASLTGAGAIFDPG